MLVALALRLAVPWYLLLMGVAVTQFTLIFSVTPGRWGFWRGAGPLCSASAAKWTCIPCSLSAAGVCADLYSALCLLAFAWIRESPARLFRSVLSASRQPAARRGSETSTQM